MGALLLLVKSPLFRRVALVLGAILSVWGVYQAVGSRFTDACEKAHQQAMAESIARAAEQARSIALQDAEVLGTTYQTLEKLRVIYREREQGVTDAIPQDCRLCALSPAGLGLLNDAITNAPASGVDARSAAPAVPRPPTPPGWQFPGSGREVGGTDRKVL